MYRYIKILFYCFLFTSALMVSSCDESTSKPQEKIENPTFSINPGLYNRVLEVELSTNIDQATIHYTLDGSQPSQNSPIYQEAILIVTTTTIKAIAYHDSYLPSETLSGTFWLQLASVQEPVFLTEPGSYYYQQSIAIDCPTSDADIFYTLDGSEPNQQSFKYEEAFLLTETSILKARAYKEYYPASSIVTGSYEITMPSTAAPIFNPSPGEYDLDQTVQLSCSTEDAKIYYTLDSSTPTENSFLYTSPLYIDSNKTIKIIAMKEDYFPSPVVTGHYIIEYQKVANPEFSLESGYYLGNQSVSIVTSTPDALIYYTLDDSDPSESSQLYTGPIEISSPTIIKARAYKTDYNDSEIVVADYEVFHQSVETPVLNPPAGHYIGMRNIEITCATPGALIYYTINGSEPSESTFLYDAPLSIYESITINARAYADGYYPSDIISSHFLLGEPAPNDFVLVEGGTFHNGIGNVTLDSFYMSDHEITQSEYYYIMGIHPATAYGGGPSHPVYYLNWYEAVAYCNARSMQEYLTPCYNLTDWSCNYEAEGYRLPTEMEWMYAAKGGSLQPATDYNQYAGTDSEELLITFAWYNMISNNRCYPVRNKFPNQLGLYDMSGNVNEWCNDWYGEYSSEDQINPTGPTSGYSKVIRGGSWFHDHHRCKVTNRVDQNPSSISPNVGFRVVRKIY